MVEGKEGKKKDLHTSYCLTYDEHTLLESEIKKNNKKVRSIKCLASKIANSTER